MLIDWRPFLLPGLNQGYRKVKKLFPSLLNLFIFSSWFRVPCVHRSPVHSQFFRLSEDIRQEPPAGCCARCQGPPASQEVSLREHLRSRRRSDHPDRACSACCGPRLLPNENTSYQTASKTDAESSSRKSTHAFYPPSPGIEARSSTHLPG